MSPWLPVSPCTPGCLPVAEARCVAARLVRAARAARRGLLVAVLLGLGAVAALAAPLLGQAALVVVQRRWCLALLAAAGVRLRRTGGAPVPDGVGALVVANHVSWLDVLALHAVAPVRMLAKQEVRTWPLLGAMAARTGTVFLERDRLRDLPAAVTRLADVVRGGGAVGVFPEGTTRCGRALGPFRPAAFQAAVDGGVAVQPVALHYSDGGAAFVGDDTLLSSLGRVLPARGVELEVAVLAPLAARPRCTGDAHAAARRDLARRCEAAVAEALGTVPASTVPASTVPVRPTEPVEPAGAAEVVVAVEADEVVVAGPEVLDRVA